MFFGLKWPHYIIQLWVAINLSATVPSVSALEPKCLQSPMSGHPVEIVDLHPSDKQYVMLKEIQQLGLILMEPGICLNDMVNGNDGPWFRARVFINKGKSAAFSHRGVIKLEAGKFK